LLRNYGTPDHVVRHCKAVTEAALRIGRALNANGINLNLKLLEAAALLHDIARVEENHGSVGAEIAENNGYYGVAELIRHHMSYVSDPNSAKISEKDVLCLSDRMVKEDKYIGLDARMKYILDKFTDDYEATKRINKRIKDNRIILDRIEEIIGIKIDELMK